MFHAYLSFKAIILPGTEIPPKFKKNKNKIKKIKKVRNPTHLIVKQWYQLLSTPYSQQASRCVVTGNLLTTQETSQVM